MALQESSYDRRRTLGCVSRRICWSPSLQQLGMSFAVVSTGPPRGRSASKTVLVPSSMQLRHCRGPGERPRRAGLLLGQTRLLPIMAVDPLAEALQKNLGLLHVKSRSKTTRSSMSKDAILQNKKLSLPHVRHPSCARTIRLRSLDAFSNRHL